ncbi:hypothetical protein FKP32DRAFT_1603808 [Trametes sanguinea]|nr:hypothetical protein FKP32DRAFT_1603808 [Trametes sanguinea]
MDFEAIDALAPVYSTSKPTKHRRKSKRKAKGGKAGNQGTFQGPRHDFLAEHLPAFIKLKGAARAQQKDFWQKLYNAYWHKWPWYVPRDKEPEDGEWPVPDLDDEDNVRQKGEVIEQTQAVYLRSSKDVWEPLFRDLRDLARPPVPPRAMHPWQLYMSKNPDKISKRFDEEWDSARLPPNQQLAFRGRMARELLALESEEYRQSLEREVEAMHLAAKSEPPPREPDTEESIQTAQDQIAGVVQPMLEMLRERTGYYFTLFVGVPMVTGPREFKLKLITAGKTAGPNAQAWHESKGDRFKSDVMGSFTRFLTKTPEYAQRVGLQSGNMPTLPTSSLQTPAPMSAPSNLSALLVMPSDQENGLPTAKTKSSGKSSSSVPGKAGQHRTKQKRPARRKGKQVARASGSESSAESSSDDSDTETSSFDGEDSSSDESEPQDEIDLSPPDGPYSLDGVPEESDLPSAEDLGMGQIIANELSRLSSDERRAHLHRFLQLSDTLRAELRCQAEAAVALNGNNPAPIPLYLPTTRPPPKPRRKLPPPQPLPVAGLTALPLAAKSLPLDSNSLAESSRYLDTTIIVNDDGWPDWLRQAYDYIEGRRLGRLLGQALDWWTVLERKYDFQTSAKALPAEHRPPEVHDWIRRNRRNFLKPPVISNPSSYIASWWAWWAAMQPDWRATNDLGQPVIGGHGDWDCLRNPGKNGMLMVLLSLVWWREQWPEQSATDWKMAVKDVTWVLASMATTVDLDNPDSNEEERMEEDTPVSSSNTERPAVRRSKRQAPDGEQGSSKKRRK